jgi:hypothetical protein
MGKRTRVPGLIAADQTLGNSGLRFESGVNRWRSADVNDGNWTLYDPNNGIVSVVTSTDGMRIVSDKDETAHRFGTGDSNQNAGRWHTKLKTPDGADLKWNDFFQVEILVKKHAMHANLTGDDKSGLTVGIANSDITNSSTVEWLGSTLFFIGTNVEQQLKCFVGGHQSTASGTDNDLVGTHTVIGHAIDDDDGTDNPAVRIVTATLLNSSNQAVHPTSNGFKIHSINTDEFTGTDDVYLFVCANHSTTGGSTANPDATWKVWYRVQLARDGLAPTYIPGGGSSG